MNFHIEFQAGDQETALDEFVRKFAEGLKF
jgi:hypothetical protein